MPLKALLINYTLKKSPETSNTEALLQKAAYLLEWEKVQTEMIRLVDLNILPGTASNMGVGDDFPMVLSKIKACDILIVG